MHQADCLYGGFPKIGVPLVPFLRVPLRGPYRALMCWAYDRQLVLPGWRVASSASAFPSFLLRTRQQQLEHEGRVREMKAVAPLWRSRGMLGMLGMLGMRLTSSTALGQSGESRGLLHTVLLPEEASGGWARGTGRAVLMMHWLCQSRDGLHPHALRLLRFGLQVAGLTRSSSPQLKVTPTSPSTERGRA